MKGFLAGHPWGKLADPALKIPTPTVADPANVATGSSTAPFVGRGREMALMQAALSEVANGSGRIVLIGGEAGIGKTRLVEEFSARAQELGVDVYWGRCWEGEGGMAYWPWVQIIRAYVRRAGQDALDAIPKSVASDIVGLVPELRDRFSADLSALDAANLEQSRFRQFDSIANLLRSATLIRPMVLLIDDLHMADQSSMKLVRFIGGEAREMGVMILGTYRDEVNAPTSLADLLGNLLRSPYALHIKLDGISSSDIREFMSATAGTSVSEALVSAVYRESDGNPLFVCEIVRYLLMKGESLSEWRSSRERLGIPETVRSAIKLRVAALSPTTRRMLEVASVIGRLFALEIVERAAQLSHREVLDCIEEVIRYRIIVRASDVVGEYRFAHSLIREVLYDTIPESERIELHRSIGEALEMDVVLPETYVALSHHWFRALPVVDAAKVVQMSRKAAIGAVKLLAYEEAADCYERAIIAYPKKSDDLGLFCELVLEKGDVLNKAGNIASAQEAFRRAVEIARVLRSPQFFSRAVLGLGGSLVGSVGVANGELLNLFREALLLHGSTRNADYARLLAGWSILLHFQGSTEFRVDIADQAVLIARAAKDQGAELFALDASHQSHSGPGSLAKRVAIAHQMTALAYATNDKEMELRGRLRMCTNLLEVGDISGADKSLAAFSRLATELRQPGYQWVSFAIMGSRALMEGKLDNARRCAVAGLRIGSQVADPRAEVAFWGQRFIASMDFGELNDLEGELSEFASKYGEVRIWEAISIYLLAELGRSSVALKRLESMTLEMDAILLDDELTLGTLAVLALASGVLGAGNAADLLWARLAPFQRQNVIFGVGGLFLGSVAHYLGLLAAAKDDHAVATNQFEHAVSSHEGAGARPLAAKSRYELGRALSNLGRDGDGAIQLRRAIAEFEDLGMRGWHAKGHQALERIVSRSQVGTSIDDFESVAFKLTGRGVFRSDGDFWTLSFAGRTVRMKGVRGFHYIAYLLARAHEPVHVLDLAVLGVGPRSRGTGQMLADQEELTLAGAGSPGMVMDERARAQYRARLRELSAERDEAEGLNDYGRLERIDGEIDALQTHLTAGSAVGGRSRGWASPRERARVSVRNAIAKAYRLIEQHHEPLHRHLRNTLKTGVVCTYTPEQGVSWDITTG